MAVGFILDFPSGNSDQYDAVIEKMDLDGHVGAPGAPGGLSHVAGPGPDGGLRVVDSWESDALFEEFAAAKIGPLAAETGLGEPVITRFEIDDIRGERARGDATFAQVVRFDGMDRDGFKAMDAEVTGGELPAALVHHVNGPTADGGWIVVDTWASKAERDTFMEERVGPVAARAEEPPPQIEELEIHNTLEPL